MHPTDQTSTERKKKYSDTTQFCMVSIKIAVTLGSLSGLQIIGSLRTYDGNCNEKRHIKIELLVKLSLSRLFHVDHVVQNRRIPLSLAWYEWFSCKGKE